MFLIRETKGDIVVCRILDKTSSPRRRARVFGFSNTKRSLWGNRELWVRIFGLEICDLQFLRPFFATSSPKASPISSRNSSPNIFSDFAARFFADFFRRKSSPNFLAASLRRKSSPQFLAQVFAASFRPDTPILCDMFTNMHSNIHV